MRTTLILVAAALLVLVVAASGPAQNLNSWQQRADAAVRANVTDATAERMRKILYSDGKNDKIESIVVEPDGNGVLARVKITWSGIVIAVPYSATIRWRFDATRHISSDVESAFGMGVILHNDRVALDDFLRTELYPRVQAAAK